MVYNGKIFNVDRIRTVIAKEHPFTASNDPSIKNLWDYWVRKWGNYKFSTLGPADNFELLEVKIPKRKKLADKP